MGASSLIAAGINSSSIPEGSILRVLSSYPGCSGEVVQVLLLGGFVLTRTQLYNRARTHTLDLPRDC